MNLYFLFTVLLYIGGSNARVVPLNFRPDKCKRMDARISENELIDESPVDKLEIGHSLPDIEKSNDLEVLIPEDKKTSSLESSNRNASNLSVDLVSREKDMHRESNLGSTESLVISDLLDKEFNVTSQFISKNDSNFKESMRTLHLNGIMNDEEIANVTVKNETFITNHSSSRDLEQRSNIEFAEIEEKILNDAMDPQNETSAVYEVFSDTNNTDNSRPLPPMSNETEVENFLSNTENITDPQNGTSAVFEAFNGTNHTDNFNPLPPMSNETEVQNFLSNTDNITDPQNDTSAIFEVFKGANNTNDFHQLPSLANDTEIENFLSNTENITNHQNETSAIFEVFNGTKNDISLQFQPLPNDTEVGVFEDDTENITVEFESNNLVTEDLSITDNSIKNEGILSGFEFLINSEVARNAAKAMEVFNFSDPLTDHIMEENEFHSFLPAFNGDQILDSASLTDLKTEQFITNSSTKSNEIRADLNTSLPSGEESSIILNQTETLGIKRNSMAFNLNETLLGRNETELFNSAEVQKGNVTSEISTPLENPEETIKLESGVTTLEDKINGSVSNSSSVGVPECPPPGICIFWFLSQDTCAVNEHCLGNRICCQIRCSKTCIEIESL